MDDKIKPNTDTNEKLDKILEEEEDKEKMLEELTKLITNKEDLWTPQ